jgi:hypothetical protein
MGKAGLGFAIQKSSQTNVGKALNAFSLRANLARIGTVFAVLWSKVNKSPFNTNPPFPRTIPVLCIRSIYVFYSPIIILPPSFFIQFISVLCA